MLAVHGRKGRPGHSHKGEKTTSSITCENCGKSGHAKLDLYLKGGGKEGQWLKQKKFSKQREKKSESTAVAKEEDEELFAFTCTSNYVALTNSLKLLKDKYGTCIDSSASDQYCPRRA